MYRKPNRIVYTFATFVSSIFSKFIFKRTILRNEIKNIDGPFVVIANHECALDFVNLIGLSKKPMSFVISNSFYSTLPLKKVFDKLSVIPKQQFQTTRGNLRDIKAVIDSGNPLVIYPAGLMCEDGLSTPIPQGTYKFLKWLGVPVYIAKITGSYFVMPKWSKGLNPGKTYIDIHRVFSKEELLELELPEIRKITRSELLFNAYKEQEKLGVIYKRRGEISGLKNVLYICPNCKSEFTIYEKDKYTLACSKCCYEVVSDELYMLNRVSNFGPQIKYVSDWNKMILEQIDNNLNSNIDTELIDVTDIYMIDHKKHKFIYVGNGMVTLNKENIYILGTINGEKKEIKLNTSSYPTLPFKPGKYFEVQDNDTIYRLELKDGKKVIKYINTIKRYYRLNNNITEELE